MSQQQTSSAPFPVNMREGVVWAYRHLLGREPNDEAAIDVHLGHTPASLRDAFKNSAEYRLREGPDVPSPSLEALLSPFRPFSTTPAPAGAWRDFLGVVTRCEFLPDNYVAWSGLLQGPPGSPNGPLHGVEEWAGTLRSVLEARDQLVVFELGAGWAPWLVSSARAAERVGIKNVRLIGVEGSLGHIEYMRNHLLDNGIDPARHSLIHGIVGTTDGTAYFPKLAQPNNNYGSEANYQRQNNGVEMEEIPSISLNCLLDADPVIDLIHCDIQGMEAEAFRAGREIVHERVRRVVIGTHSRKIEADLLDLFSGLGWILEEEVVCKLVQATNFKMLLREDGTQVWRNPKFIAKN